MPRRRIFRDGWLRTGDLGSIDDDGYLHFHRLKKPILNIHGNKIDPVEVCRVLCSLPAVSWAEVSATSGDSPDTKLRARICKVPGAYSGTARHPSPLPLPPRSLQGPRRDRVYYAA